MIRGLWTAATGMAAQQMNIDTVSNNLANANTAGFKKSRANFQDLMYQTSLIAGATTPAGSQVPTGIQVGMGVKPSSVQKLYTQGNFVQTGNDMDIAIEGEGFVNAPPLNQRFRRGFYQAVARNVSIPIRKIFRAAL